MQDQVLLARLVWQLLEEGLAVAPVGNLGLNMIGLTEEVLEQVGKGGTVGTR